MTRSLQGRIVATTVVLLAVVCAVVGVGAALSLERYLGQQLDQDVVRTLGVAADPPPGFGAGIRPPPPDAGGGFAGPDATLSRIEVRSVDGRIVSATAFGGLRGGEEPVAAEVVAPLLAVEASGPPPADDGPGTPAALAGGPRPVTVDLDDLGSYRAAAATAADGTTVVVGISTDRLDATVSQLARTETVIFGLGVVVAGVVAAFATRRTLRPLHRVSATARRVSELPLSRGEVELDDRVAAPDADPRSEVGQVGVAFNRMLEHVGSALAARQASETRLRQFVADASHELRTPLAAIRGYTELARRRSGELPDDVVGMLDRVGSQTERMSLLVEDLLLLARLDAGRPLAREEVDLVRIVADAVTDAHAAAPDHRWSLDLPDSAESAEGAGSGVVGDRERLTQVVANLLANARTHTPAGTTVVVGVARTGDRVALEVRDDGPGIPPELLPHVTERFARGDAGRARTTGSTGLGLAIVAAVVAEHGGTLAVTSTPGDTRVVVDLPTVAALPAQAAAPPAHEPAPPPA